MKLVIFPTETRGLNWTLKTDPFLRFETNLIFGRNKRDKAFLPIVGFEPNDQMTNVEVAIYRNAKGTSVLKPGNPGNNPGFLVLLTVEGGFRGGVTLYKSEGDLILKASASAACESAIAVATVLQPRQKIVFISTGRYGTKYHIYKARLDEVVLTTMSKSEYEFVYEEEGIE